MMPADEVKKELLKRYSADPKGWRVLVGRDSKGYYDLIVLHGSDMWQVKEFRLNPYESVGFGVRDRVKENEFLRKVSSTHPFGLRPLSPQQVKKAVNALQSERDVNGLLRQIMQTEPVSPSRVTSSIVAQGPVMHYPNPTSLISGGQRELDLKLRSELDTLLQRKHSHLFRQYV